MTVRTLNARTITPPALLSLSLILMACGGGSSPPPGTPVTSLNDSGPGSLRDAITAAASGDTLRLTQSGTLTLQGPLVIGKSVTIIATGVTVDAAGKGRALEVASGANLTVQGGTFKGGVGVVLPAGLNPTHLNPGYLTGSFGPARLEPAAVLRAAHLRAQAVTPTYGGVLLNAGTLTLDGVTVTGGRANNGGGIYNAPGAALTLKGTTSVNGNTADLADPNDDTLYQGNGGGIFSRGALTLAGGSVGSNTATYAGGGIFGDEGNTLTISGGKVDGNTTTYPVTVVGSLTTGGAGGGIYTNGELTMTGGSVSGNTTAYFGGGITVQNTCADTQCTVLLRPVFKLSGGTIENNAQTNTSNVGGGGGIWSSGANTISGGTIRGNSADYGAGVNVWYNLDLTGGVIQDNQARQAGGGMVFLNAGRTYHIGGAAQISGNTAVGAGGGIYILRSAQVTMDGGSIRANTVTGTTDGGGGARIAAGSSLTLAGGEIRDNMAVKTGGGITVGGSVTMTGGAITGNRVTNRTSGADTGGGGGGVRLYTGSSMTASGGTISGNSAWYGGGVETNGAFRISPTSTFVLSGATVSGNRADGLDGGGFWNDGSLTVQSGSVTGNSARSGGGVFNTRVAVYAQPGGSVTGNTPDNVFTVP